MKAYVITTRAIDINEEPFARLEETAVVIDPEAAKQQFDKQVLWADEWLGDCDYHLHPVIDRLDDNTCCIVAGNKRRMEKYVCLITLREVEVQ